MVAFEPRIGNSGRIAAVDVGVQSRLCALEFFNRHPDVFRVTIEDMEENVPVHSQNVLGGRLQSCCVAPMTGFYRDGYCRTGPHDYGLHIVCAEMTEEFLVFSQQRGNDLSTPRPEYEFPGLKPGDRWCLCVERWKEAYNAGFAPHVILEATSASALEFVTLEQLEEYRVD